MSPLVVVLVYVVMWLLIAGIVAFSFIVLNIPESPGDTKRDTEDAVTFSLLITMIWPALLFLAVIFGPVFWVVHIFKKFILPGVSNPLFAARQRRLARVSD